MSDCPKACEHCSPEFWHACVRPRGHRGYHGCQMEPSDYDEGSSDE